MRNNSFVHHHTNRRQHYTQTATTFAIEGIVDASAVYVLVDDVVTTMRQQYGWLQLDVSLSTDYFVSVKIT